MTLVSVLAFALFLAMLFLPGDISQGIRENLTICATIIIPSLYIFIVLGELFIGEKLFNAISRLLMPFSKPFGIGGEGLAVFLFGALCGFPYGARMGASLYRNGIISRKQLIIICCICNNASISFILTVGASISPYALAVYIIQLLSALPIGVLLNKCIKEEYEYCSLINISDKASVTVTEAISSSALIMLNICACVVFFGSVGSYIASYCGQFGIIIKGIFEFSSGIVKLNSGIMKNSFLMSAFISFGGLSVHAQVNYLTKEYKIYKYFLISKVLQCIISFIVLYLYINIS